MAARTNMNIFWAVSLFLLVIGSPVSAKTIYVDIDASPGGAGTSWADANNSLHDALTDAYANRPSEVRVAEGTYKPEPPNQFELRAATFAIYYGMNVKGGYAGFDEPDPNYRNIDLHETILSGDVDGDDIPVAPSNLLTEPTRSDNCFNVVICSGLDETAILDGFTVTGGSSLDASPHDGGGIRFQGGGTVLNCTIVGNSAYEGGGVDVYGGINVVFIDCDFIGNVAENTGGGINTTFLPGVSASFTNCQFSGNLAGSDGGAYRTTHDNPTFTNCTFSENSSGGTGGVFCITTNGGTADFNNCILWGNTSVGSGNQISINSSLATVGVSYSDVEGGNSSSAIYVSAGTLIWGSGNINSNPLFVDADGPDNTVGTADDDVHVSDGSPCIDAAKNSAVPSGITTDLDGNPRFVDDPNKTDTGSGSAPIVDMGAYEARRYIYVDTDAAGSNNGTNWADAYTYLQNGLSAATSSWGQILVAQGTYKPDQGSDVTSGDRTASFGLTSGIRIKGGYAGDGESDPDKRNINTYQTILSGDLDSNDVEISDPCDLQNEPTRGDNSYHVVTAGSTDATAVLEGFTVTAGNADGSGSNNLGGGMYSSASSPTLSRCTFTRSWASSGGGIYGDAASSPTLGGCILHGNASNDGGGMYNSSDSTSLTNCTLSDNLANSNGGGIYSYQTLPVLTNSIFWGNSDSGGSDESAQVYRHLYFGSPDVNYCCVQGWGGSLGGPDNFDSDPCFVDVNSGDYHLLWSSGCINAGDPNFIFDANDRDFDGEPRVMVTLIDVGVDEVGEKQADFTRDGIINGDDLDVLVQAWPSTAGDDSWYILCDLYEDSGISFADYSEFGNDWRWQANWYEP